VALRNRSRADCKAEVLKQAKTLTLSQDSEEAPMKHAGGKPQGLMTGGTLNRLGPS
jgi:hypothetical protein